MFYPGSIIENIHCSSNGTPMDRIDTAAIAAASCFRSMRRKRIPLTMRYIVYKGRNTNTGWMNGNRLIRICTIARVDIEAITKQLPKSVANALAQY